MLKRIVILVSFLLSTAIAINANEGWKTLENWRQIENGQSPKTVRKHLGEPARIEGGTFTEWKYPNGGKVTFYEGTTYSWTEPSDLTDPQENLSSDSVDIIILAFALGLLAVYLVPMVWVLASGRSHGGAKFGWFLVAIVFSWIGLAAFLILTQSQKNQARVA